jgi:hypothetical protein
MINNMLYGVYMWEFQGSKTCIFYHCFTTSTLLKYAFYIPCCKYWIIIIIEFIQVYLAY